jgi:hypothetical protein
VKSIKSVEWPSLPYFSVRGSVVDRATVVYVCYLPVQKTVSTLLPCSFMLRKYLLSVFKWRLSPAEGPTALSETGSYETVSLLTRKKRGLRGALSLDGAGKTQFG